jgi:hypothetical protein
MWIGWQKTASTSQSTLCPNPEEHHQYRHRRENLKSYFLIATQENFCYSHLNTDEFEIPMKMRKI